MSISAYRRSILPLLVGTGFLRANSGAVTIVLGLFLAQISTHTERIITSLQVGLLPVTFYITELTLAPIMGSLSDRWGRRTFLVLGPFFGLIQVSLLFFIPTTNPLPYLLCLQAIAGVSGAMSVPATLSYLADFTVADQAQRMRIMSFYELVTSGGIALGTVLGGLFWDRFGRAAFLLLAAGYLMAALCMALSPVVNQVASREHIQVVIVRYWRIIRMPRLLIFIPAWLCISALVGVWLSSQLIFLLSAPVHDPYQVLMGSFYAPGSGSRLSLILGSYVVFFGLSLLFWATFGSRVPRERLMLISIFGVYLVCLALFGINHRGAHNDSVFFIWVPLLMLGIFAETGFAPTALAYLADISEDTARDRGLIMGLYSIFLSLGQILGNGIGGIFARLYGFDGLIYLTLLLGFVALISLIWLFNREKGISRRRLLQVPLDKKEETRE